MAEHEAAELSPAEDMDAAGHVAKVVHWLLAGLRLRSTRQPYKGEKAYATQIWAAPTRREFF
jgi:hypothetical protein